MGQNLAIATTAMNAADDAMDNQIIALEQLRRADQISERDFNLKQEQLTSQKGLLDAQASYYKNYRDMQVEIAELKEIGDTQVANRRLYQSILDLAAANLPAYQMAAKAELGATDMFSPEVRARADAMMKQAVQTEYRDAQRFFDLPETDGAGLGADVRSELETYVGQQ
jgi:DNA-binding ferritin-like protein (Dps family)